MKTKTALIISGILVAAFGFGVYVHIRSRRAKELQMKIAEETGSIKKPATVTDPVINSSWLLGGD